MKLAIRIALALIAVIVLATGSCLAYVKVSDEPLYEFKPLGITATTDPEVIARGSYLANGAMHCTTCHMHGEMERALSEPPGTMFSAAGGTDMVIPVFGTFRPVNLTPHETGIKNMSDEHLARVIKYGVGEDGRVKPFMALAVGVASDEDIRAVISYLRSLEPVDNAVEPDDYGLLGEIMLKTGKLGPKKFPTPAYAAPTEEPSIARGEYLANGPAFCVGCHSPADPAEGFAITGEPFSGCLAADPAKDGSDVELCPPNLTPSKTGMTTRWTEQQFLDRVSKGYVTLASTMPWGHYSTMTDSDLRSIWRYLAQLPPVERDTGPSMREPGTFTMPD